MTKILRKKGFTPHLSQKGGVKSFLCFSRKKGAGFTLIELLVVIAIIGLLASIVLVSLGGARDRAKDARIISDMGQIRTTAVIYEGNNNTYVGLCADDDILTLKTDIETQGGTGYTCAGATSTFCVSVTLNNDDSWCADSELTSVQGKACGGTPVLCQ